MNKNSKEHLEQHLLVFCNIIYVFTDTCDQFNTLLLKKINHIQKKILLTPNFKFNLQIVYIQYFKENMKLHSFQLIYIFMFLLIYSSGRK